MAVDDNPETLKPVMEAVKKKLALKDIKIEYKILLEKREIKNKYQNYNFDNICFLCSEETNEFCHRRLLSEYLFSKKEIINL